MKQVKQYNHEKQNLNDFYKLKKKQLGGKSRIISPLKTYRLIGKIRRIPKGFLRYFNQKSYLDANVDIQKAINQKLYDSSLEHFILYGYDEVKEGKRQIGREFPLFSEKEYLNGNSDIQDALNKRRIFSAFDHFIQFGYGEFLNGQRMLRGNYPFSWTPSLETYVKRYFDERLYLMQNPDVANAIAKEVFVNAWEHFFLFGAEEIRKGQRALYPCIPKISEKVYFLNNRDILTEVKYKEAKTPFEHFLRYGVEEIMAGKRILKQEGVYQYITPVLTEKVKEKMATLKKQPLISVIMPVYNTEVKWLDEAIYSLEEQWYGSWELCIADDASTKKETVNFLKNLNHPKIKISYLKENMNISMASNEALSLAEGEYVALMDHDDLLTPDALYEMVVAMNEKNADFIYSDEDKVEGDNTFSEPHFKPDFAPDMFLSQNYISHLSVIKTELIRAVGGWERGLEGSQDYDLYLKVLEYTDKIYHIPKVLYHWRKIPGSTAALYSDKSYAQESGRKALEHAMQRREIEAKVINGKYPGTYKVEYLLKEQPLVSIIIPFKDKPELLKMSIESVIHNSTYQHFEIIGISNNSEKQETFDEIKRLKSLDKRIQFYEYNVPFNYSKINNYAVSQYARGEHIVLMNNDIEMITPQWIEEMLLFSQRDNVGAVGAKLYYPDDTIQHAGVIIGIGGVAGHSHKYFDRHAIGYFSRLHLIQNMSAVTGACLMVKKEIYMKIEGLNEKDLTVAFNDVDFCLRLRELGYVNIFTPYVEAYHHESISRGLEDSPQKQKRFENEAKFMHSKWKNILKDGDPYYNINLTLKGENFQVK